MHPKDCLILIPSLAPDEKLQLYVDDLLAADFGHVLVINDGSSEKYLPIFNELAQRERVTVLHHAVNRGKGAALRTGYAHVLEHTDFQGVITADADGQHIVSDTLKIADLLDPNNNEMVLGSRDFSGKEKKVPLRSCFGNRATSCVFALFYGKWLPDTQTGLRAINRNLLPDCLTITGDRYEYEMNQLMQFVNKKIPMTIFPIDTVYLDDNESSHFHPIRDSFRIYKLLFTGFFKFMSSGLVATLVDLLLFTLLNSWVLEHLMPDSTFFFLGMAHSTRFWVATSTARICSASLNFLLNKNYVFRAKETKGVLWRYILLGVLCIILSSTFVGQLNTFMHLPDHSILNTVNKGIVDSLLFLFNFRIQKAWVFADKKNRKEK